MSKQTKPDIVLIVLDTLRADRLSCYGYGRETTPNIDAFAEDSVMFDHAISPAQWTIPAHASLFTGQYPSTHMTTQIYDKHSGNQVTLAQALKQAGYHTVGFCNNPLLGVVENDLDRGFDDLYIYGGAIPNRPSISDARPHVWGRAMQRMERILRRASVSVQDVFARNNFLLRIALSPLFAPFWQRHGNFKGNTTLSLRDAVGYLRTRQHKRADRPAFVFINLMETHLPFGPPARFIRRFAPYYWKNRKARSFMRSFNRSPYRWMLPLTEPLTDLQDRVLNDLYDAEVAYEDHLLRHLLEYLNESQARENTLVFVTSDHGEGMNRHNFVGHTLVAYDDLVRVPLLVRYPEKYPAGSRVSVPVSTRRIFHSALEVAGALQVGDALNEDIKTLTLTNSLGDTDPEDGVVFSEAYTPETLLALMEGENEAVIEAFRCNLMRRAAYRGSYKLITVGDQPDELFNVVDDPDELHNLIDKESSVATELDELLKSFVAAAEQQRSVEQSARIQVEDDALIAERLRGLGYIE